MKKTGTIAWLQVDWSQAQEVYLAEVLDACVGRVSQIVFDVMRQQPAIYWRIDGQYFFDDVRFGQIVEVGELDYSLALGLHRKTDE